MNRKERRAQATHAPHAEANKLFAKAVALHQAGNLKECVPFYRKVLALLPAVPEAHHNLGIALKGLGKTADALECYRKAIAHNPDYADAFNSLGNGLSDLGRFEEAADCFRHALSLAPHSAAAHNNLGAVLLDLEQLDAAEASFRQAIALDTAYAEAHNNLGACLARQERADEAMGCYDRALALDPSHPRAHANRAQLLFAQGQLEPALEAGLLAVALSPQSGHANNTVANILKALGRLDQAVPHYATAVRAQPHLPELHDNLGNVLSELGRSHEAETHCRQALVLSPDFHKAHNNLGTALKDQGRRDEAEACFHRALELAPTMAAAHTNLGMSLLAKGEFAQGWREFEWRWNTGKLAPPAFKQPRWTGFDIAGKIIVLTAEQGLGDVLQFARFAQPIAARGATVILQVHKALTGLLTTVPGVSRTVALDDPLPDFDTYLPLMSAPLVLGTTLDTIPLTIPYVTALPNNSASAIPGTGLKVGLAWSGDPRPHDQGANAADRRRSIPLALLTPILSLPGIAFISLQKGQAERQIHDLPPQLRPFDPMAAITDFTETAALVDQLDLIITVDTSIAHLAGAMGKQVWVMSRYDGCWRWLTNRDDSPWYPTLRLFRQTKLGQWSDVIETVKSELLNFHHDP